MSVCFFIFYFLFSYIIAITIVGVRSFRIPCIVPSYIIVLTVHRLAAFVSFYQSVNLYDRTYILLFFIPFHAISFTFLGSERERGSFICHRGIIHYSCSFYLDASILLSGTFLTHDYSPDGKKMLCVSMNESSPVYEQPKIKLCGRHTMSQRAEISSRQRVRRPILLVAMHPKYITCPRLGNSCTQKQCPCTD